MIPGGMGYKDVITDQSNSKLTAQQGAQLPTAL